MYVALTHERQTLALRMDLSNADLASCSIRDAIFFSARLRNTNFNHSMIYRCVFDDAQITAAKLHGTALIETDIAPFLRVASRGGSRALSDHFLRLNTEFNSQVGKCRSRKSRSLVGRLLGEEVSEAVFGDLLEEYTRRCELSAFKRRIWLVSQILTSVFPLILLRIRSLWREFRKTS
jgi:Pentapeptide repeats (8 copies)